MAGVSFWKQCLQSLTSAFEYLWAYMGTLAAMGVVVGVLAMGIFHSCTQDGSGPEYRCFTGLINCASAQTPIGTGEVGRVDTGSYLRFEYGPQGRLERLVYIGADGSHSAIPGSKVAEQRMEYDPSGRLVAKRNYAVSGEATEDASGVSARVYSYDDAGRLVRTTLLNAAGEKVVPRMPGYAEECITYDAAGRPARIEYLDGTGRPVTNAAGESVVVFTYDDAHHETARTNTVDGKISENHAGIAIERHSSTEDGHSELVSWHDKAGKPVQNPQQGCVAQLDERFDSDHLHRKRLCAEDGVMPIATRTCTEHLERMTAEGRLEWECYNAADGLPCDNPKLGYAERVCEYDGNGNLSCEYFWDGKGLPCPCYEKRYTTSADGVRHVLSLHTDGSTSVRPVE